jgi:hemerythrin-like domain-containing protein
MKWKNDMERIFDALREDHEKQRSMLKKLLTTEGDSKERRTIYKSLKDELKAHAVAEERFFYKPMMDDDAAIKKARHSIAEHHEIDEFLEELDKTDMSSPGWIATAKNLSKKVHHHLDEEEQEIFKSAGIALSETVKKRLAGQFREEKKLQLSS